MSVVPVVPLVHARPPHHARRRHHARRTRHARHYLRARHYLARTTPSARYYLGQLVSRLIPSDTTPSARDTAPA